METVAATSNRITIAAAGVTGWSWLTSNEFYGFVGAVVAIGGLLLTWYYKRKADRRMIEEHDLRIKERQLRIAMMRSTGDPFAGERPTETDLGALESVNG